MRECSSFLQGFSLGRGLASIAKLHRVIFAITDSCSECFSLERTTVLLIKTWIFDPILKSVGN
jgi:hypothetical protein